MTRTAAMSFWLSALTLFGCLERSASTTSSPPRAARPEAPKPTPLSLGFGSRPFALVELLPASPLKTRLSSCRENAPQKSVLSIGHRGAPRYYPEHTKEGYALAAKRGAGLIECDVVFTRDEVAVCRHATCDLHATTNILDTPLKDKCRVPPLADHPKERARAQCCVSDLEFTEFSSLCGKQADEAHHRDNTDDDSETGEPEKASCGTLVSHEQSIQLLDSLGVDFIPELKRTSKGPLEKQDKQRAHAFLAAYRDARIDSARVFPQSFDLDTIAYFQQALPEYARQAIYLDGQFESRGFDASNPSSFSLDMSDLAARNIFAIGAPYFILLQENGGRLEPSAYALEAKRAGLSIFAWTLDRPSMAQLAKTNFHLRASFSTVQRAEYFQLVDALARTSGILGIFTDDPAPLTYYANCFDI